MSVREKIVVILAVISVICGIYNFFPRSSTEKKPISDDVYMIIDNINKALTEKKILDAELFVINQIHSDWRDIFKIKKITHENKEKIIDIPIPEFSGYLAVGNKVFAILDGNEYQAGEKLLDSGYTVEKIFPGNVVIRKIDGTELIVFMEEAD